MKSKTLREDRTAAGWKSVAKATRRRLRILRAGFFFIRNNRGLMKQENDAEIFFKEENKHGYF